MKLQSISGVAIGSHLPSGTSEHITL